MSTKHTNYIKKLLDSKDSASIKRLTVLIGLCLFVINTLYSLFTRTTLANTELIRENNYYCFLIIAVGILGIGVEYVGNAIVEKAKAIAAGTPSTINSIQNVEGDVKASGADNKQKPEEGVVEK